MKIAVPLDLNKKDVCPAFGRAPYFAFDENGGVEIVENPAAKSRGGAGIKAAQFAIDSGARAIITVRCGQNAADVFKAAGVKIYEAAGTDAEKNFAALKAGELSELTRFHAGFNGAV